MDDALTTTDRLTIRPWGLADADALLELRSHPEVARWMVDTAPWADRQVAVETIRRWRRELAEHPDLGTWAIVPHGESRPVGSVSLKAIDGGDGEVEVGWALHPRAWGRGYAREAGGAMLDHARRLRLPQVWALMWPGNDASARVCRAIGMEDLGVRRDPWYGGDSHVFRLTTHTDRTAP